MTPLIRRVGLLLIIMYTFSPFMAFLLRVGVNASFTYLISSTAYVAFTCVLFVNTQKLYFPKYLLYYGLFVLYTFLSDALIVGFKPFDFKYMYGNTMIYSFVVLVLIENADYPEMFVKRIININTVILFIAFFVIVIQQVKNNRFFVDPSFGKEYFYAEKDTQIRLPSIYSFIGGSITAGLSFIPILSYVIADRLKNNKSGVALFFFMGAIFSFLTKYRWIMINYIVLLFLIPIYRKLNAAKVFLISATIAGVLFGSYFVLDKLNVPVQKYLVERVFESDKNDIKNTSAGTRLIAIEVFSELFPRNPILGRGERIWSYGADGDPELKWALKGRSSQIHVGFLALLYTYGIIGGVFYIVFVVFLMNKLYKDALIHKNWGIFFAFIGFILANTTLVQFPIMDLGTVITLGLNRYLLEKEKAKQLDNQPAVTPATTIKLTE